MYKSVIKSSLAGLLIIFGFVFTIPLHSVNNRKLKKRKYIHFSELLCSVPTVNYQCYCASMTAYFLAPFNSLLILVLMAYNHLTSFRKIFLNTLWHSYRGKRAGRFVREREREREREKESPSNRLLIFQHGKLAAVLGFQLR